MSIRLLVISSIFYLSLPANLVSQIIVQGIQCHGALKMHHLWALENVPPPLTTVSGHSKPVTNGHLKNRPLMGT